MSIAQFSLAAASIANATPNDSTTRKPPPKRTTVALADTRLVPEPR